MTSHLFVPTLIRRLVTVLALCGITAGCVSVTQPVAVGPDTYMVGLGAHGGLQSDTELLKQSIQAGNNFCASQNKVIQVVSTSTSGVQGWTPQQNQVIFKCVAAPRS